MADDDLLTMYDAQLRGMPEMVDAPEVVAIGAVLAAGTHRRSVMSRR